jgi:antitoxin component YwqK of YwqJK toxin-antitoxin module
MAENTYIIKHSKLLEVHTEYYEDGKIKSQFSCNNKGWGKVKNYDENGNEIKQ